MLVARQIPEGVYISPRRKRRQPRVSARREAASLDTCTYLQTTANPTQKQTAAEWLKEQETAHDRRRKLSGLHERYVRTLIVLSSRYEHVKREAAVDGATGHDRGYESELKRRNAQKFKPWKTLKRVADCQTSFMGFRAKCCDSRGVAVPIVCNDRLCPLCNAHRADHFRTRLVHLFGTLSNAYMVTLTVPNVKRLTSHTYKVLRKRLRAFLREYKGVILGGAYSIETTYNSITKDWHPHIHVLVDLGGERRLPYWEWCARKWRIEFDWLVLTQGRPSPGKRLWKRGEFAEWVKGVDPRKSKKHGKTAERRVVDLRPCTNDRKAANEIVKYLTKSADFVDNADAVEEFMNATHGVRVIQTFGSCYGVKLDEPTLTEAIAKAKRCECGQNQWEKIGVIGLGMTTMGPDGKWYIRDDAPIYGRGTCRGSTHSHVHNAHGA